MIGFFIGLITGSVFGLSAFAVLKAAGDEDRYYEKCFKDKNDIKY